ncbi:Alpha/beta hydrolase family protein [Mariprofundus ferrinatatus]|uniref:Alpha/beta hydrolase family protein n=1 Tax=Mariprofundus ferrinatatus TaxID=1921087 RepID=A0A2K8LCW8_9PROT|nr:alpha/beta fold hydrolase [Mariprofundus ferrinatatus]ATX82744.1 Alpha/beta hydrolase family protein [Mariprofundus ferrinatatus]
MNMLCNGRLFNRFIIVMLSLLLSACATKSDRQVVEDLWSVWEKSEVLFQTSYPDAPPLVLVHGWNGGEFTWPVPEKLLELEQRLGRDIILFTYRTGFFANRYPPLEVLEEQLDRYLAPYPEVDIVAHSMGGLLVRQYLSHHASHPVRRVLFLATPHFGTNLAQVLVSVGGMAPEGNIQATEIKPGSDFLWQLNSLMGSELDGVEVLNLYAAKESLLQADLVVSTSSAYLPWASNLEMKGDHHTLAKQFDENPVAIRFLSTGEIPQAQPMPDRRDVWMRFKVGGEESKLTEANFKSYNARGIPNENFRLCCKLRSGLYSKPGEKTAIIEELESGNYYAFMRYGGLEPVLLSADELMKGSLPVTLKLVDLDPKPASIEDEPAKDETQPTGMP